MRISVVTTLYQSAPYLEEFHRRMLATLAQHTEDYELVYVNDGSPDDSLQIAKRLVEQDAHVKVVDLSRNFGHHKAAMTGLAHADGDLVFLIDVDLEEEPELLTPFLETLNGEQADVAYGVQDQRQGRFLERRLGGLYYRIFNLLSDVEIPRDLLMARLMTRRYVDALVSHREALFDISGLWSLTGFHQVPLVVSKGKKGETTYTFRKRFGLMVRGIVSFSNKPLVLISGIGSLILLGSFLYGLYVLGVYFFVGEVPTGYASLILSIWFLGGLTIFLLGVIAIYLSVIFVEVKHRPYSVVRQVHTHSGEQS